MCTKSGGDTAKEKKSMPLIKDTETPGTLIGQQGIRYD